MLSQGVVYFLVLKCLEPFWCQDHNLEAV